MVDTNKLTAHQIIKTFSQHSGAVVVLNGLSAEFIQGNTYALTGTSGAGKSTLLHLLAGFDEPTDGTIMFNDRSLTAFSVQEKSSWLTTKIGFMFQQPYLIKELSVLENVMIKGLIAGMPKDECQHKAHVLLTKVGLVDKIKSSPATLSGGQQARVALARALFNEPAFLFADEPTGNLDATTAQVVIELLLECQQLWGMGLVVSSHDQYVASRMMATMRLHNGLLSVQ